MSTNKRIEKDVIKLLTSDYEVDVIKDNMSEFTILFDGPKDSPYEGFIQQIVCGKFEGRWKLCVYLPAEYPYKSPSIGFMNKIFHPNIDLASGSICLDVINQTWSPMYELKNVFDVFIPQLLLYPNPSDPLNGDAAHLMMNDKEKYEETIKKYVNKYGNLDCVVGKTTNDEEIKDENDDNKSNAGSELSATSGIENGDDSDEPIDNDEEEKEVDEEE